MLTQGRPARRANPGLEDAAPLGHRLATRRLNSVRRAINRAAVDDRLQQIVVKIIRAGINGTWSLTLVVELGADLRVEEVSAGDKFGQDAEAGWVGLLQLGDEGGGVETTRRCQELFQTGGEIGTD